MLPRGPALGLISRSTTQILSKRTLTRTSQQPRPEPKHYRLWAMPGDFVYRKDILAKQYTMKWHPGLNAGIDNERIIYALCDGVVVITEEKFEPDWDNHLVQEVYIKNDVKLPPQYARYIHVIPKKRISEFKLVDLI